MTDIDDGANSVDESKQALLEQRDIDDIQHVMNSEQGRRVVWSLLEKGGVFGICFSVDPYATAFNEGQRNLALSLFQQVMAYCPDQYLKMAGEASKKE